MKFRPLGDRILIKPDVAKDKTEKGILLPEQAKRKPLTGVVVAVGPGVTNEKGILIPTTIKAGDKVQYVQYASIEVDLDETGKDADKHLVCREGEILGVIED